MRSVLVTVAFALVVAPLSGCFLANQNNELGGSGSPSGGGTTEEQVAQYNDLQKELEQRRSQFLPPGAAGIQGIGTRLLWMDFASLPPHLHSADIPTETRVDYTFSIGGSETYNMRASEDLVVTADISGGLTYHVYDITKPNAELGSFSLPDPNFDVKWWAYAPDHTDVYAVVTGGKTTLKRWSVGATEATDLFDFEDIGIQVGEFQDFGVQGNVLVLIESGRIWSVDLATKTATFLQNKQEADAAWLDADGVLYEAANGPFFFDFAARELTDVGAAIAASKTFRLNDTFASAQLYDQAGSNHDGTSLARFHRNVGYLGESGLFSYNLDTHVVQPILLDALDDSVVYGSPVFLDDGSVFVQGFMSNEGDVGTDGPVFRVQPGF